MLPNTLIFITCLAFFGLCFGLDVGDSCTHKKTGSGGRCQLISQCPSARVDLMKGILPSTCSFSGSVPIVCCIESSGPPSTTTIRTTTPTKATTTERPVTTPSGPLKVGDLSKIKCQEYGRAVYQLVRPPIFGFSGFVNESVCGFVSVPLIVGGTPAKPKEFPHQALLGYGEEHEKTWQCGGSLVSDSFVLTAAHCTDNSQVGPVKFIRLGDLNYERTNDDAKPEDFNVVEVIKHPGWKPPQQYNDIALLRMDRAVIFNAYIRPVCLQTSFVIDPTREDSTDPRFIATGWGRVEYGGATSADLLKVILDSFSQERCSRTYKSTSKRKLPNGIMQETQLCAGGDKEEKDTCQGDSGGPITVYNYDVYCMYKIVGVTSFGKTCGVTGVPGVYTRVSHYVDWIEKTIWTI